MSIEACKYDAQDYAEQDYAQHNISKQQLDFQIELHELFAVQALEYNNK